MAEPVRKDVDISSLSVHSLRVELLRRGLQTDGVKGALRARLLSSFGEKSVVSVPSTFPRRGAVAAAARRRAAEALDAERAAKRARVDAVGTLVAGSIWVTCIDAMNVVWDISDGYGKGNLSRSEPMYALSTATRQTLRQGRAARQLILLESAGKAEGADEDKEEMEHLQLTPVEGFHAAFDTKRIRLMTMDGRRLDDAQLVWKAFCRDDPYFAATYAAYTMYRRAGWMPRSGLKYGVDWVLYRAGQRRHSHAPYCLILSHGEDGLQRSWIRLQNKLRLVKNVAKTLIAARVSLDLPEPHLPQSPKDAVDAVRVTELTIDRWVS